MSKTTSRRRFLGRSAQALGALAFLGGARSGRAAALAPSATEMNEKAVAFLRTRQDAQGGWSTGREPGITALVVTAMLRTSAEVWPTRLQGSQSGVG